MASELELTESAFQMRSVLSQLALARALLDGDGLNRTDDTGPSWPLKTSSSFPVCEQRNIQAAVLDNFVRDRFRLRRSALEQRIDGRDKNKKRLHQLTCMDHR